MSYTIVGKFGGTKIYLTGELVYKENQKVYKSQEVSDNMVKLTTMSAKFDYWKRIRTEGGHLTGKVMVDGNKIDFYKLVFDKPKTNDKGKSQLIKLQIRDKEGNYKGLSWTYLKDEYAKGLADLKEGDVNSRWVLWLNTKINKVNIPTHSVVVSKGKGVLFFNIFSRQDSNYDPTKFKKKETPSQETDVDEIFI
jgi:hypothetical protein